jgi:hypothetical protein
MQKQWSYFEARVAVIEVDVDMHAGGRRCIPGRSSRSMFNPRF